MLALALTMALAQPPDLDALQWRERVLVLFADTAEDPSLIDQRAHLEGSEAGLTDRRLRVIEQVGPSASLRASLGISEGFAAVLVGLDGGIKRTEREPIATASLFATIDAMPMRAAELRRRAEGAQSPQ